VKVVCVCCESCVCLLWKLFDGC